MKHISYFTRGKIILIVHHFTIEGETHGRVSDFIIISSTLKEIILTFGDPLDLLAR